MAYKLYKNRNNFWNILYDNDKSPGVYSNAAVLRKHQYILRVLEFPMFTYAVEACVCFQMIG